MPTPVPLAAAVPASAMKCPLPMLLANSDAPTYDTHTHTHTRRLTATPTLQTPQVHYVSQRRQSRTELYGHRQHALSYEFSEVQPYVVFELRESTDRQTDIGLLITTLWLLGAR